MAKSLPAIRTGVLVAAAGLSVGCAQQPPRVGISSPAVFTVAHMNAAMDAYQRDAQSDPALAGGRASRLSVFADLQRNFATRTDAWPQTQLRMDEMLAQTQSNASFSRAFVAALAVRAGIGTGVSAPTSNSAAPAAGTDPLEPSASDLALLQAVLSEEPNDSPFDRLERARAFYSSYMLALLRLYRQDSRVIDPGSFNPLAAAME